MPRLPCALLALCCLAATVAAAPAQSGPQGSTQSSIQSGAGLNVIPHDALELVKVLTVQEREWNAGHLDAFLQGYKNSPDTTFVSGSVQHGFSQMAAHYHGSYPSREAMGNLSFSDLEPRLLDDRFGVLTGKYTLERAKKFGGNSTGLFSLVFEKTDSGWKIIVDHTD